VCVRVCVCVCFLVCWYCVLLLLISMGDYGNNPLSMGRIKHQIETDFPELYVVSLVIGSSDSEDQMNGFFKNVNDQIEFVCQQLAADPKLQHGFNAMGFSRMKQTNKTQTNKRTTIGQGDKDRDSYSILN